MEYGLENIDISSIDAGNQGSVVGTQGDVGSQSQSTVTDNSQNMGYDPNMVIKYKASGRELAEPLSSVINRAQRGYDYAQLVAQHKQQEAQMQAQWQQRQQELAAIEQQWRPYHDFALQNPQWADHVKQAWENRFNSNQQQQQQFGQSGQDFTDQQQSMQLPPQVQQELAEMRQFIAETKQREQMAVQAQQDEALNSEIENVRKSFPDIDFGMTDPQTGESLEMRIMRHAQENRIHNFSAAFRDFYFDKLQERAVLQAKEQVAKNLQSQNKQGFLGKSDQSMIGTGNLPPNSRSMSYHQLMDMAAKDLGF